MSLSSTFMKIAAVSCVVGGSFAIPAAAQAGTWAVNVAHCPALQTKYKIKSTHRSKQAVRQVSCPAGAWTYQLAVGEVFPSSYVFTPPRTIYVQAGRTYYKKPTPRGGSTLINIVIR